MTETTLNFGPQWLHKMVNPQDKTGFKLADYRYGREEMLVLFDRHQCKPPEGLEENLSNIPGIFVKDTQLPVNMSEMSMEEARLWTLGANSETSIKMYSKDASRGGRGGGYSGMTPIRGRGRGRGGFFDRQRSLNEDDPESGYPGSGAGRGGFGKGNE